MEKSTLDRTKIGNHVIHSKLVMDWAKVLHWFDKRQILLAIHGVTPKRHRRMEIDLRRLAKRGKLRTTYYGRKLIYALPRKSRNIDGSKVYHGLACTECLIRLKREWVDAEIIPERTFVGCGSVPDGGLLNENKLLALEFTTKDNFFFSGNMRGKLSAYKRNIYIIEEKFKAKVIVLFVIDVPREKVVNFVGSLGSLAGSEELPDGEDSPLPLYFIDYETFLKYKLTDQVFFYSNGKEMAIRK